MRITPSKESADTAEPAPSPAEGSTRRLRVAMGTWVAIEATAANPPRELAPLADSTQLAAIEAAYESIRLVEQAMHPHRHGSDLARINAAPLHMPIEIQPDTWRVLHLARRLYELTDGVFDPCLPSQPGSLQDVELDLGGIAKGYAVDRAVETLMAHGCCAGLVNAGGDLRVFGEREEAVLLREPDTSFRRLALRNAALAVSDIDAIDRPAEHQGYYSRKGKTAARRYAAVIAKDAATADALTKCVLLCEPHHAARALRELEATLA
jgi:thiamine biosynthesis lipoprotein